MLTVMFVNIVVVALAVIVHYEVLYRMVLIMPKLSMPPRYRIVIGVFVSLMAHAIEVWIFAFAYFFIVQTGTWGELRGNFTGSLMDCAYFSFTTFSTLGFGDIEPVGNIRYLTGIESLTGLVLVTWTASFLFIEMQRLWTKP